ncbi:MAG: hypothetical protein GXP08_05370 [Gammaproteobacteria bacterium]|nr:hypothetical protein [Gammaproteobacteria bacterium]
MQTSTKIYTNTLSFKSQQGSVLTISLFLLLVLTIIGASALNNTIMDEKMAANLQNNVIAFQAAESTKGRTLIDTAQTDDILLQAIQSDNNNDPAPTTTYILQGNIVNNGEVVYRGMSNIFGSTANIGDPNRKVGYRMDITSNGAVINTNASAQTLQGTVKGPYPFAIQ